jgi:ribokinase
LGGKGLNQAISAKRMGKSVGFMGAIGDDFLGNFIKKQVSEEQIGDYISIRSGVHTGCAFIMVDEAGSNIIGVAPGANRTLSKSDIDQGVIKKSKFIISQLEIPSSTILHAFSIAKGSGVKTVLNPAPSKEIPEGLFELCDFFIPNELELGFYVGSKISDVNCVRKVAQSILKKGVKNLIVTLGEKGCVYIGIDGEHYVSPPKVKVVDTTAAGDVFIGAFVSHLVSGNGILEALKFASAASALCVTKKGAVSSIPYYNEVVKLLNGYTNKCNPSEHNGSSE